MEFREFSMFDTPTDILNAVKSYDIKHNGYAPSPKKGVLLIFIAL
jgi:hypothetical protein